MILESRCLSESEANPIKHFNKISEVLYTISGFEFHHWCVHFLHTTVTRLKADPSAQTLLENSIESEGLIGCRF